MHRQPPKPQASGFLKQTPPGRNRPARLSPGRFHTWGNRRGRFPPEKMPTKFGVVALFPGRPIVDQYVALDVSLQKTAVCVLNASGSVVIEAELPSEPAALTAFIQIHAPRAARVGLESGPTSPWLWHSLKAAGLPVVCMDARHAHAALSVRPSKSDRNDARGLAEMVRMGWYREVQVKSLAAHERMALLGVR